MKILGSKSGMGIIQWIALVALVAAMFSASKSAALPAIYALLRFLWPLLLVWLIWRFFKAKVSGVVGKFQDQVMNAAGQGNMHSVGGDAAAAGFGRGTKAKASRAPGEVLDLCPKCGVLLSKDHRCR